jgi:hypothetical protein
VKSTKNTINIPVIAVSAMALAGCASTPAVIYDYYPARSSTTFTITQTVDCTADQSRVVTVNSPQATSAYTADLRGAPYELPIESLDGQFSDSDIAVKLTEDGRLESINQSTTGEGETILKSVVTVAAAAAAIGGGAPTKVAKPKVLPECTVIKNVGGGKPVTLIYTLVVPDLASFGPGNKYITMTNANDAGLYASLKKQLPVLAIQINSASVLASGPRYSGSDSGVVLLTLQIVALVPVDFEVGGQKLATAYVVTPTGGNYKLPIPKAKLFGKQNFALTLADSGAVTSIEYGKNSGGAGALNVLGSAMTAATPETTAEQAADIKAQADKIAQQQRLARCMAKPDQCQ